MLGNNRMDSGKKKGGNSGNGGGKLLQELEALSKALYRNDNPPRRLVPAPSTAGGFDYLQSRSASTGKTHKNDPKHGTSDQRSSVGVFKENPSLNRQRSSVGGFKENPSLSGSRKGPVVQEKKGLWNWKPLRALGHSKNRTYTCSFSLQVHSVEGLSMNFSGMSLMVHWKRKDGALQTKPAKVLHGVSVFGETMTYKCSVCFSVTGLNQTVKYEAKQFLLSVASVGSPEIDLGKHKIDLARLLPETLEELESKRTHNWPMNFKLSGKAKGAILVVTFGFSILGDDLAQTIEAGSNKDPLAKVEKTGFFNAKPATAKSVTGFKRDDQNLHRRVGSLPGAINVSQGRSPPKSHPSRSTDDVKILHEVLPSFRPEYAGLSNREQQLKTQKFDNGGLASLVDSELEPHDFPEPNEPQSLQELKPKHALESTEECVDDGSEFTVIEQGVEVSEPLSEAVHDLVELEENLKTFDGHSMGNIRPSMINTGDELALTEVSRPVQNLHDRFPLDVNDSLKHDKRDETDIYYGEDVVVDDHKSKDDELLNEELVIEELEAAFGNSSLTIEPAGLDYLAQEKISNLERPMKIKSEYEISKFGRSNSLDDLTESVATEFLSMLGIEHSPFSLSSDSDPESPRGRLWKQFERDSLAGGSGLFGLDVGSRGKEAQLASSSFQNPNAPAQSNWDLDEDFELSSVMLAAEMEHQKATQAVRSKTRAKMLEDAETEALMQEWGLNEKAFERSPPGSAGGFGSPIDLPPEEPLDLPSLGYGLGPFVQTKDGGFIRTMNPSLFKNSKNNTSLVVQVSSPVVVPAEMGSGIMEILQRLASVGIEKLSMQANKLMPLEDITEKTMQQISWESAPALEEHERQDLLQHIDSEGSSSQDAFAGRKMGTSGRKSKTNSSSSIGDTGSEFVSLEDLAPLAMDKIEALSMEGLKIQSGMADEDAPSNVTPQSIGEISAFEGMVAKTSGSLGLEGTAGLQLLDIKDSGDSVDGLMGLSITLDEWMKLDAGIVDEEQQGSDRTSKILAAHHASFTELEANRKGKNSGKKWGFMGNNFTVALMVQLRDPLRNYEPVGTPMLALIQVERLVVPPKPKIYCSVSEKGNSEEVDEPDEPVAPMPKEEKKEEEIPQFRIKEVHLAGLKTEKAEPGKKLWGGSKQQQSGSRWLLASGMGKANKHPLMKSSKAVPKPQQVTTTTVKPGDTLWSISSRVHGTGAKWKELAALNPHIRNPNVILPNETIRLR